MAFVISASANWAEAVSAVAATAGVLATLAVGWWAWRAAVPHRKLAYSIEATPLLSSTHSGLTVNLGSERITSPQTATLKVINVGNREIETPHFNSESIEFDMNARVVSVLASSSTDNRRVPPASAHGNTLQIEPYPIHKGQEVSYKLLLDGQSPRLTLRHSLSAKFGEDNRSKRTQYVLMALLAVVTGMLGIMLWTGYSVIKEIELKDQKGLEQRIQDQNQWWYDKGKTEGEKAAREGSSTGSAPATTPNTTPSSR
ncbi:hypothetical protein PUR49_10520 [Streptomyces sp. BE147]|uniref:hypothetical protein n=1 Tax=Streptomyces sp. BE147 TaxID=3002524 RepID=UPI002E7A60AA|nr:hypothetical protein [Streptomyces sp. BE147]MEE1736931.1 hypothetical protein [Streptomyces sp. BE147]